MRRPTRLNAFLNWLSLKTGAPKSPAILWPKGVFLLKHWKKCPSSPKFKGKWNFSKQKAIPPWKSPAKFRFFPGGTFKAVGSGKALIPRPNKKGQKKFFVRHESSMVLGTVRVQRQGSHVPAARWRHVRHPSQAPPRHACPSGLRHAFCAHRFQSCPRRRCRIDLARRQNGPAPARPTTGSSSSPRWIRNVSTAE